MGCQDNIGEELRRMDLMASIGAMAQLYRGLNLTPQEPLNRHLRRPTASICAFASYEAGVPELHPPALDNMTVLCDLRAHLLDCTSNRAVTCRCLPVASLSSSHIVRGPTLSNLRVSMLHVDGLSRT